MNRKWLMVSLAIVFLISLFAGSFHLVPFMVSKVICVSAGVAFGVILGIPPDRWPVA